MTICSPSHEEDRSFAHLKRSCCRGALRVTAGAASLPAPRTRRTSLSSQLLEEDAGLAVHLQRRPTEAAAGGETCALSGRPQAAPGAAARLCVVKGGKTRRRGPTGAGPGVEGPRTPSWQRPAPLLPEAWPVSKLPPAGDACAHGPGPQWNQPNCSPDPQHRLTVRLSRRQPTPGQQAEDAGPSGHVPYRNQSRQAKGLRGHVAHVDQSR